MAPPGFRIFILGAGFSCPASLPTGAQLWQEVWRRAQGLSGRAECIRDDLDDYLDFRRACDAPSIARDDIDFEDFLAFLDVEHYLGLRGSDTGSSQGNESQVVVKTLIGEILAERLPLKDAVPPLYLRFARALRPGDYVLTFNYDVLLERALEAAGTPFRLFPERIREIRGSTAILDSSIEEVVVLKLHGSIDWFDDGEHQELQEEALGRGFPEGPPHPVFSNRDELGVTKLLEGLRFPNDPLKHMHRVEAVEALYRRKIMFSATPSMLSPSSMKLLGAQAFRDFWYGAGSAGSLNLGLAIIGYSMPPADGYARRIIYNMVRNYQRRYWDKGIMDMKKSPLLLVDLRNDDDAVKGYRERYGFVDWDRARVVPTGFDESVVAMFE